MHRFTQYFSLKVLSLSIIVLTLGLSSCEDGDNPLPTGLTEEEVIRGLKSALEVGTDTAVNILSATDGYYGDEIVKILLPPEADVIFDNLQLIPGGNQLMEETILSINRAAEDAAIEATPIFVTAITDITINDGFAILNGEDTSATNYLRTNTSGELFTVFQPKVETSLSKEIIPGVSAENSYASLVDSYNTVADNSLGLLDPITQNTLSAYTTSKALSGLFIKVADEEKLIRKDPLHRVNDILERVFGSTD